MNIIASNAPVLLKNLLFAYNNVLRLPLTITIVNFYNFLDSLFLSFSIVIKSF
jgi:hypothetical protein